MKTSITLILAVLLWISASAQSNLNPYYQNKTPEEINPTKAYFGFSTGINNMVGLLGVRLDAVVNEHITIGTGIGLSSWGYKWTVNLQYYPAGYYGFFVKGGYTSNSGLDDMETELELASGQDRNVRMDLAKVGNIQLAAGYAWRVGKWSKFYLEGGYAVPLKTEDYYTLHDETIELSYESEQVMQILRPGGLIFALGICIAM